MSNAKDDPKHTPPPMHHSDPHPQHGMGEVMPKDVQKSEKDMTPEEKKAKEDEEKAKATRSEWQGKIKSVIESKPGMKTTEDGLAPPVEAVNTATVTATNAVVTSGDVAIKGQPATTESAKQKKAMQDYEKKVADLNKDMEKLGEDKGVNSPEYGEAHRLMALSFR